MDPKVKDEIVIEYIFNKIYCSKNCIKATANIELDDLISCG